MIKYAFILFLSGLSLASRAQSNSILLRHDTTLLIDRECEWVIKSLAKNDPTLTVQIGKPVSQVILEAIHKGRIKAIDPENNQPIPGNKIFTWKRSVDTIMQFDVAGNYSGKVAVGHDLSPESIRQIRVFQDWFIDIASGKLNADIKWIELMVDVNSASGEFIGSRPFCRIYY